MTVAMRMLMSASGKSPVPPVPEHVELQYVTVDAAKSQYVKTGIVASPSTRIEVRFRIGLSSATAKPNYCVAGGRESYNGPTFMIWGSTAAGVRPRFDMHTAGKPQATGATVSGITDSAAEVCTARKFGAENWDNGTKLADNAFAETDSGYEIYLMAGNEKDSVKCPMSGDVYHFKSFDADGAVTMNLVPVRKASDGGIYFYDKVTGQYFGNAGTSAPLDVTAGPEA